STTVEASLILVALQGIISFSPCVRCSLDALADEAVAMAKKALAGKHRWRLSVRRAGRHDFRTSDVIHRLAESIAREFPAATIDLKAREATLGVEIRGDDCYLSHRAIQGIDYRGGAAHPPASPARFLVDQMMGRLTTWLRLLGYDTTRAKDEPDSALLRAARA